MARAVVQAGWNLLELKSSTTLEEVFIELTGADQTAAEQPEPWPIAENSNEKRLDHLPARTIFVLRFADSLGFARSFRRP